MTIALKPNGDGSAEIQVNGVSRINISAAGVVTFPSNPVRTWQNVTRVVGTLYTNNTPNEISVFANLQGAGGTSGQIVSITVGGVVIGNVSQVANNGVSVQVSFNVPAGATYQFNSVTGVLPITTCSELR